MEIYTQQEANYLHISIGGKFNHHDWDVLEKIVQNKDDMQVWLILAMSHYSGYSDIEVWHAIVELSSFCSKNQGLLVLTGIEREMVEMCEKLGLTILPTLDEAIDYIFIEQLERDMDQDK
jgi:hypothetical protein